MGKILVEARIENFEDQYKVELGLLSPDQARLVVVPDALVDTGAALLSLPRRLIQKLGLRPNRMRQVRTPAGTVTAQQYEAVRVTIQGHDCLTDVTELPDDCPVLVGQLTIEHLDLVVDPVGQRLIGNPAHGGEQMIELY